MKYFNSAVLMKIEQAVNELNRCVVDVVLSRDIAEIRSEINKPKVPLVQSRPRATPFFVDRVRELNQMKSILDVYGSVAVMQYGVLARHSWQLHSQRELKEMAGFPVVHTG